MLFGDNKFICPYCYEKHSEKDCIYTCSYNIMGNKKDCKYDYPKKSDGTIALNYLPKCKKCDNAKLSRYCPTKTKGGRLWEIPERACGNTFSIALIGAKQSGKSNYIAVLVDEIKKKMARNMDCSLIFCNQQTNDTYQNTYYKPLYENSITVKGTDAIDEIPPLIYSIDFFDKTSKSYRIKSSITLSLYDTAGENFDKEQSMLCNNQYISNASGIIVLLDPLQLPSIRAKLEGKVNLPDRNNDTVNILNYVINLIKSMKKIKGTIDIPIALAFTKMDVLAQYDILPEESCLRTQSEHITKGAFVRSDFENTNIEIKALLENFLVDEIMHLLREFSTHAFFGVSSLGENPVDGVRLAGTPSPIRVLDPLLWLLALKKYIKTI